MSARPVPIVQHTSFIPITGQTHRYGESTELGVNIWIIILTAIIFYGVLSWYNFFLALYSWFIGSNPNNIDNPDEENFNTVILTLGFAIFWTVVAILAYYFFQK